jgi:hypothetical protein
MPAPGDPALANVFVACWPDVRSLSVPWKESLPLEDIENELS